MLLDANLKLLDMWIRCSVRIRIHPFQGIRYVDPPLFSTDLYLSFSRGSVPYVDPLLFSADSYLRIRIRFFQGISFLYTAGYQNFIHKRWMLLWHCDFHKPTCTRIHIGRKMKRKIRIRIHEQYVFCFSRNGMDLMLLLFGFGFP